MLELSVDRRRTPTSCQLSGLQTCEERNADKEVAEIFGTTTGRVFSFNLTTPDVDFEAALRGRREDQQRHQTHQVAVAGPTTVEPGVPAALFQNEQQITGQLVRAPNVNSLYLDKILKVVIAVVQQIMTESNGAVLEEAKIVASIKIFLNLTEQSGH
jgi:hypothetical protein